MIVNTRHLPLDQLISVSLHPPSLSVWYFSSALSLPSPPPSTHPVSRPLSAGPPQSLVSPLPLRILPSFFFLPFHFYHLSLQSGLTHLLVDTGPWELNPPLGFNSLKGRVHCTRVTNTNTPWVFSFFLRCLLLLRCGSGDLQSIVGLVVRNSYLDRVSCCFISDHLYPVTAVIHFWWRSCDGLRCVWSVAMESHRLCCYHQATDCAM